jgi:hypothetical protein
METSFFMKLRGAPHSRETPMEPSAKRTKKSDKAKANKERGIYSAKHIRLQEAYKAKK